jgi:carbamoyltransferase
MNILGISGQERDAAAAIIKEGRLVAAIEEEKFARIRHVGMSYIGGLPDRAIEFCLDRAGVSDGEIDCVAYYMEPHKLFLRSVAFRAARLAKGPSAASIQAFPYYLVSSLDDLRRRLRTRRLAERRFGSRFIAVNHQLAHAASAFYPSGFDSAAIIVAGNVGDMVSLALLIGRGEKIEPVAQARFPNSIGMVYSAVTAALGFDPEDDLHKTMWLSATGKDEYGELFRDLIQLGRNGLLRVNLNYFEASFLGRPSLSEAFFERAGLKPRSKGEPLLEAHRNLAASLQSRVEEVFCQMTSRFRRETGLENLCMAGGVLFNSMINSAVERESGFKRIFVQPAAGNAGCSLGAALYVWHAMLGNRERRYKMDHLFLGPGFDQEEIKMVLDNCKVAYEYFPTEDRLIAEVAELLAKGKIVGWFRGAMEFGPRALGARSILASPAGQMMRDNLNIYIKHREEFRPFSAAVPEELAEEFFERTSLGAFLQGVSRVRPEKRELIPAAVFGDSLVRVHTVNRETSPAFWKLLQKFGALTGVPILLNTSFNLFGEPVVSTPREAVRGFYCSGIDCLAIDNFLVKK